MVARLDGPPKVTSVRLHGTRSKWAIGDARECQHRERNQGMEIRGFWEVQRAKGW